MLKQMYRLVVLFVLMLVFGVFTAKACPPPVTIEVNCPTGDCDITIVTGDNNEISQEGKKGPIAEIVDDILDFLGGIFKKKEGGGDDGGGGEGDGGGTETETPGGDGGETPGGGDGGSGEGTESTSQSSSFEKHLDQIANYFEGATITKEGVVLQYPPQTETCKSGLTMTYNIDIPIPQNWLKKYNITGKRKLKAGTYTTTKKGRLLLPFKNA